MKLTKGEVRERLCRLATEVMSKKFGYLQPADCFCKDHTKGDYQFSDEILKYVEDAVNQKMEKEARDGTDTDAETGAPVAEPTGT